MERPPWKLTSTRYCKPGMRPIGQGGSCCDDTQPEYSLKRFPNSDDSEDNDHKKHDDRWHGDGRLPGDSRPAWRHVGVRSCCPMARCSVGGCERCGDLDENDFDDADFREEDTQRDSRWHGDGRLPGETRPAWRHVGVKHCCPDKVCAIGGCDDCEATPRTRKEVNEYYSNATRKTAPPQRRPAPARPSSKPRPRSPQGRSPSPEPARPESSLMPSREPRRRVLQGEKRLLATWVQPQYTVRQVIVHPGYMYVPQAHVPCAPVYRPHDAPIWYRPFAPAHTAPPRLAW